MWLKGGFKCTWYLEWNIQIVNVNYNPFTKYNLHDGDLAIILLVIVPSDVVQCNVTLILMI